jgi:hypothetical protein
MVATPTINRLQKKRDKLQHLQQGGIASVLDRLQIQQ